MSVNDPLPWVDPLCALLRSAVTARVPVLGHCLGGQLLAKAMGARVGPAAVAEIGWIDVDVAANDAGREWFGDCRRFRTFQWHYEAFELPHGAVPVLANEWNRNQGYVLDGCHLGLQCHVEVTAEIVADWVAGGGAELPAISSPVLQSAADILDELAPRVAALQLVTDRLYARWARGLRT